MDRVKCFGGRFKTAWGCRGVQVVESHLVTSSLDSLMLAGLGV